MRIVAQNILAGGGPRVPHLAETLLGRDPDVLVLGEYHAKRSGKELAWLLERGGLTHQARGSDDPKARAVFVASRRPFTLEPFPEWPTAESHRVLVLRFENLRLVATYFPASPPHIAEMFLPVLAATERLRSFPTLLIGDLNAGANPHDTEGSMLSAGHRFEETLAAGWTDVWRHHNPEAREFTWYSPKKNGFRLDHALLLGADPASISCHYDHSIREQNLSDHSMLEVVWEHHAPNRNG